MSYDYKVQRSFVFTEEGQLTFLKIRDKAQLLLKQSEAATSGAIMSGCCGDTWNILACVDRLVEIGELVEIPNPISKAGQHRIFIARY